MTDLELLIAPEGIEMVLVECRFGTDAELLIAPEGIEIILNNTHCALFLALNRTRRN